MGKLLMATKRIDDLVTREARAIMAATGAHTVLSGIKERAGVPTGQPALVVAVSKKLPLADIHPAARVPARVGGVPTDVVELQQARTRLLPSCETDQLYGCDNAVARSRPLLGGLSCYHTLHERVYAEGAGTLGGIVRDATDGKLVGITNNHVAGLAYNADFGAPWYAEQDNAKVIMHQPAPVDFGLGGNLDRIGVVKRRIPTAFTQAQSVADPGLISGDVTTPGTILQYPDAPSNVVDGALIALDAGVQAGMGQLGIHGGPFPFASQSEITTGMLVYKAGRTTGRGPYQGRITSLSVTQSVNFGGEWALPPDRIVSEWDATYMETLAAVFARQIQFHSTYVGQTTQLPGDSGGLCLVLVGGVWKILGLFYAGSGVEIGYCNPIWEVAPALQIEPYDRVVAPKADNNKWYFGVECEAGEAVAALADEASPDAGAPVTPTELASGDVTFTMIHTADCITIRPSAYSTYDRMQWGVDIMPLGYWPPYAPQYCYACLTFSPAWIAKAATISEAYLILQPALTRDDSVVMTLRMGKNAQAFRPRSYDAWNGGMTRTDASVLWTIPAVTAGTPVQSPNIAALVQEVLDREDRPTGQELTVRLSADGANNDAPDHHWHLFYGFGPSLRADLAPTLRVVWA